MTATLPDGRPLILGSGSPFRSSLLMRLGLPFQVEAPDIDESPRPGESPTDLVRRLALEKAREVASRHSDALVIGSDQIADLDGRMLGKPGDHPTAVAQLQELSGRLVRFRTGLAVADAASGRAQVEVVNVDVRFRNLDDARIERYLRREQPYNCAGALRSEGLGVALIESLRGDDPNALIGLPLVCLVLMLEQEGVEVV